VRIGRVELLLQALAQALGALPVLKAADEQRVAPFDRRLGHAGAHAVVASLEHGRHRGAHGVGREPRGGRPDHALVEVDHLEGATADVEEPADLLEDLFERVPEPDRGLHDRDPIRRATLASGPC
jgi:hypothetical protein